MIVSCPSCQRNYVVADEQIAGKQFRARCKSCGVEFRLDGMPSREAGAEMSAAGEPAKFMSATEAFLALQTAPPPSNANWSVCLSQTDTRRMSTAEVAQALAKGTINTGMFVWKNGMANWVRLSEVPELMSAIGKGGARVAPSGSSVAPTPSIGPSKPAPPMRSSTLMGGVVVPSQPPTPGTSSSLPARSGQTMPPPPVVSDANQPPPIPVRQNSARPQQGAEVSKPGGSNAGVPSVAPEKAPGAIRRNTPSPPRRATLDIPVDVDVDMSPPRTPTIEGVAPVTATATAPATTPVPKASENPVPVTNAGGILLPPLKGAEAAAAPTAAAAAIVAAAAAHAQPKAAVTESKSEQSAIEATSTTSTSNRPSYSPEPSGRSKRFAGVVVTMASVGLVGVFGGIAGAVYYMKSTTNAAPQAAVVSAVALQPQAAMPGSAAPQATPVAIAPPTTAAAPSPGAADVLDGDVLAAANHAASGEKSKSAARAAPAGAVAVRQSAPVAVGITSTPAPVTKTSGKAGEAKSAPDLPSLPPAPESGATKPAAASGGAPFNRDAAMAVLGLAASRAPSCKKADGPTGAAKVYVTFDPNGTVVIANVVGSPIAGTPVAQCVAGIFRRIKVPPFSGDRASLSKDINIPP